MKSLKEQIEFVRRTRHVVNLKHTEYIKLSKNSTEMLLAIEQSLTELEEAKKGKYIGP
jgi:hypothetical protein